MGREIIFEVHDNKKCIWPEEGHDLYVCGRDDATEYMALLCDNDDEMIYLSCNDYGRYSVASSLPQTYKS